MSALRLTKSFMGRKELTQIFSDVSAKLIVEVMFCLMKL